MSLIEGAFQISRIDTRDACLVIVGGVHGDEPSGMRAIEEVKKLIRKSAWRMEGNCYVLAGNPEALKKSIRFCEENLNRAFIEPFSDTLEGKRAQEIAAWFEELISYYKNVYILDLHSVSIGDVQIAVFGSRDARSREWVKSVSIIPFRFGEPGVPPGTLTGYAEELGAICVSVECGNHSSETVVTVALEHIERALESLGMLPVATVSFKNRIHYDGEPRTYDIFDVIKPGVGFAFDDPHVRSEKFVKKGDVYAHDGKGERRAARDCYIIIPSKDPRPDDYDAGFLAVRTA